MMFRLCCSLTILLFVSACGSGASDKTPQRTNDTPNSVTNKLNIDTTLAEENNHEVNLPADELSADTLQPIRENFRRINSIANWTSVDTKDIESGEGGEVKFFYEDGAMEKIVMRQLGETFQQLAEYYLSNNKLSFAFEKNYRYNRPIYYDSIAMKENNDTEFFDFRKSTVNETRSYFKNNRLVYQVNNEKNPPSSSTEKHLKKEQDRIGKDFEKLVKLSKEK